MKVNKSKFSKILKAFVSKIYILCLIRESGLLIFI